MTVNAVMESAFAKLARCEAEERVSSKAPEEVEAPPTAVGQRVIRNKDPHGRNGGSCGGLCCHGQSGGTVQAQPTGVLQREPGLTQRYKATEPAAENAHRDAASGSLSGH